LPLNINELLNHVREYVELEAKTQVTSAEFVESFSVFGREDVVFSVRTTDPEEPDWWVVGGTTPINLYLKSKFASADEAFSFHTGLMLRLSDRNFSESAVPPDSVGYDAFICHASEDKEEIAKPLAEALIQMEFRIWYDEFELRVGDSLRRSIDKGLLNSRFGIVILSEAFFAKNWPQYELDGLTALENEGQSVILPVWHGVDREEIVHYSPPLADKIALRSNIMSVEALASKLAEKLAERT
jgi:hypothetical protein